MNYMYKQRVAESRPMFHRRQDVFDFVCTHIFMQGRQALRPNSTMCAYRGEEGRTACAGGALIPDAEYSRKMEGNSWLDLVGIERNHVGANLYCATARMLDLTPGMSQLIFELQQVHDTQQWWYDTNTMREKLANVAYQFDLNNETLNALSFDGR